MGIGNVKMNVPAKAQKPPSNFPVKVCGDLETKFYLAMHWILAWFMLLDMMSDSCNCQDPPPNAVEKCPAQTIFELWISFNKEDQGGKGEDCHTNQHHHQAKLLVGLLEGVGEGLQTSKVTDKFEHYT